MEGMYITLADGTKIDPTTGQIVKTKPVKPAYVEVPRHGEAQQLIVATRRRITDLPAPPQSMNSISVVISYTLFGLDDEEIAIATNLTIQQIQNIKMQQAYGDMYQQLVESIIQQDVADVRQLFQKKSKAAAQVMIDVVEDCEADIGTKMAAAKDILDRGGHRPADILIETRNRMEADLRIEIIKRDETQVTPVIDITPTIEGEIVNE